MSSKQNSTKRRQQKVKAKRNRQEKLKQPRWLPFAEFPIDRMVSGRPDDEKDMARQSLHGARVFINNKYQVTARKAQTGLGDMLQLAITRVDQEPARDWRDLQRIKNELLGPEGEAVELYPAESRLVDCNNVTYLYCLLHRSDEEGKPVTDENGLWVFQRFPFGFQERLVSEKARYGAKQRLWHADERPSDLVDLTEEGIKALFEQHRLRQQEAEEKAILVAQPVLEDVETLQASELPAQTLEAILGPSCAIVEARRGAGFVERVKGHVLRSVEARKKLIEEDKVVNAGEIHSIGLEIDRMLKMFREAKGDSDGGEPGTDALGEGRTGDSGGREEVSERAEGGATGTPPAAEGDGASG